MDWGQQDCRRASVRNYRVGNNEPAGSTAE